MTRAKAHAKINLGLVVGPLRADGKHELVTVLQRIELHDLVEVEPAPANLVEGYPEDTIVAAALAALARAARNEAGWRVRLTKRIPISAGLGGGSADAAAVLQLANASLDEPLTREELHALAAELGSDVPFFLTSGTQLATGTGTALDQIELPSDYTVLLVVPHGVRKESTGAVYEEFDRGDGAHGFGERAAELERRLAAVRVVHDLAQLPPNDLASSPLSDELRAHGAFRADVSGAGPTVYGLFANDLAAAVAEQAMRQRGRTLVTHPV